MNKKSRYFIISLIVMPLTLALSAGDSHARTKVGLTADDVKEVISDQKDKVRRCYDRHAKRQRGASGKFNLFLAVNPNGKVADVEVDAPTVRGDKFSRCVTRVAKRWQFPEANGGTDVSYPFRFVHGYSRKARSQSYKKRNRAKRHKKTRRAKRHKKTRRAKRVRKARRAKKSNRRRR